MSEMKKTLSVVGIAVFLGVVALVSSPRRPVPDAFFDVGEPFFPEFTDPSGGRDTRGGRVRRGDGVRDPVQSDQPRWLVDDPVAPRLSG